MVAEAKARAGELPQIRQAQLEFIEGDICNIHLDRQFDIVTSLFHVISYQTSNEALAAAFVTARSHTAAGGLFIFDFWYGPGVLSDPPRVRIKRIATPDGRELIRVSEPTFRQNENCVDVDFTLFVFDKQKRRCDLVREQHPMRYLFVPEIYGLAERSGFKVLEVMEWLTNRELALCSWNACVVAQAVD
jgi:SAM-dependent methyltransferase